MSLDCFSISRVEAFVQLILRRLMPTAIYLNPNSRGGVSSGWARMLPQHTSAGSPSFAISRQPHSDPLSTRRSYGSG